MTFEIVLGEGEATGGIEDGDIEDTSVGSRVPDKDENGIGREEDLGQG